ncbi:MAG: hypothetical protein FWE05_01210 [Defluviitaleaceae bacterium]|nr:hypothetical protein [Defluviitaleaceae bacterium]
MVQFMAGLKGEGKSRKIIEMANQDATVTDGHLVFIDDDKRNIHGLHRDIRFVELGKGELASYREFVGFVMGILSQNSDIKHIYVDGLTGILKKDDIDNDALVKMKARLDGISKVEHVDFTISIHCEVDSLPEEIKTACI